MRLDYLTIFPDYLAPLGLSLPGKAAAKGLVELHVHDLRGWTHDRHRTVDDTPYGGGAGMFPSRGARRSTSCWAAPGRPGGPARQRPWWCPAPPGGR